MPPWTLPSCWWWWARTARRPRWCTPSRQGRPECRDGQCRFEKVLVKVLGKMDNMWSVTKRVMDHLYVSVSSGHHLCTSLHSLYIVYVHVWKACWDCEAATDLVPRGSDPVLHRLLLHLLPVLHPGDRGRRAVHGRFERGCSASRYCQGARESGEDWGVNLRRRKIYETWSRCFVWVIDVISRGDANEMFAKPKITM